MNRFLYISTWIFRIVLICLVILIILLPSSSVLLEFLRMNSYLIVLVIVLYFLLEYVNSIRNEEKQKREHNTILFNLAKKSRVIVDGVCLVYLILYFIFFRDSSGLLFSIGLYFLAGVFVGYEIAYNAIKYMQQNSDKSKDS